MMHKVRNYNKVLSYMLPCLVLLMLLSCGGNTTTPTKAVDIAAESGKQISKAFLLAYETAKNLTEAGTPAQKEFALTKLNPVVNKAKQAVISFDLAVAMWQRTGNGGLEVLNSQKEMNTLYDDLQTLIIQAYALVKGV